SAATRSTRVSNAYAFPRQTLWLYLVKESAELKLYLLAVSLLLLLAPLSDGTSWSEDDSHYVPLGRRNGYYIVRPDWPLFRELELYDAPWINTSDRLRHGYGADVLAFRFNHNGVLIVPPAYIVQASINDCYTRRIGSLVRGHTTARDVEAWFGHGHSVA